MAAEDFTLAPPPEGPGARELWLQHVAGLILREDVFGYAVRRQEERTDGEMRLLDVDLAKDAWYGLCMLADGMTGAISGSGHTVRVSVSVSLHAEDDEEGEPIASLNLADGDGACMGFHGWTEGDFGSTPVTV
jgi:hypothetical protein